MDLDDDGICDTDEIQGCPDSLACNYNILSTDSITCFYALGCDTCSGENDGTGVVVDNDIDGDGVCNLDEIEGCTDTIACNYDSTTTTNTNNELCIYSMNLDVCASCSGELDGTGTIVSNDIDGDEVCDADEVIGCMDPSAFNFNNLATDSASCYPVIEGCMSEWSENYIAPIGDPMVDVNTDNSSCYRYGCVFSWAENYDAYATLDDGSCYLYGCTYEDGMINYNPLATIDDGKLYSICLWMHGRFNR